MEEAMQARIDEKLKELLERARKKKNEVDYQEVMDLFADIDISEDDFEHVLEQLEQNNIDITKMVEPEPELPDEPDDDDIEELVKEEEVDIENIDISAPDGVSVEHPVRM